MPLSVELLSLSPAPLETEIFLVSVWDRQWYCIEVLFSFVLQSSNA